MNNGPDLHEWNSVLHFSSKINAKFAFSTDLNEIFTYLKTVTTEYDYLYQ